MLVWDNQPETSVSWFVGILEGEGCFLDYRKDIEVKIANNDLDIIESCEGFLKRNHIYFATYCVRSKKGLRNEEYTISVRKSNTLIFNYPEILYKLIESKLECRLDEYQRILGSSQTERAPSVDLDWLIGIFEAEGSFSLCMNHRDRVNYQISISNTNSRIMEKVMKNLFSLGCPYHVNSRVREGRKNITDVTVAGMKRCQKFLLVTKNKWLARRNQRRTSLMLEFIDSRLAMDIKELYTDRQLQIIQIMRDLNYRG